MSFGLALAKLFEYANLPVGFDDGLAAALGLNLDLGKLGGNLPASGGKHYFVAMSFQERIDIGRARRFQRPSAPRRLRLLLQEPVLFAAKHLFRANGSSELSSTLIALAQSQAK